MTPSPMAPSGQDAFGRGLQLLQSGQAQAAVEQLQAARRLNPLEPGVLYALGNGLRLCNRPHEAAEALQATLALQPDHADAAYSLAYLYIQQAETARAAAVLLALCKTPAGEEHLERAASLLAGIKENAAAAELYEQVARRMPARGDLQLQLGVQRQKLGHYAEAAAAFERASELDPRLGSAYMLLANTRRFTDIDPELERRCRMSLEQPGLGPEDAACIHFALGKMYDDSGHYDQAFGEFRRGNELRSRSSPFDRRAWQTFVDRLMDVFRDIKFPIAAPPAAPGPAFIVGMPRSGTTLVSRLLGNAPAVHNIGETEMLDAFIQRIAEIKVAPYPDCIPALDSNELAAIAADYRHQLPGAETQAELILDKNPLNFMHIGLIALLFPGAPVIHCRRDPLDTCLSIYFQNFAHARANYAYDLDDIAAFYTGYRRLMAFWEKRLPGRLLHVDYEALVADPENVMRALYGRLDLPWSPSAARSESNPGTIATASAWQARQPIYERSVGRWHRYASHLQGLRQALEDAGPAADS